MRPPPAEEDVVGGIEGETGDVFLKMESLISFFMNLCRLCYLVWFAVEMNPLLEISKHETSHLYPVIS